MTAIKPHTTAPEISTRRTRLSAELQHRFWPVALLDLVLAAKSLGIRERRQLDFEETDEAHQAVR